MPSPDRINTVDNYFKAMKDPDRTDITKDHLKNAVKEFTKKKYRIPLAVAHHPGLTTRCFATKKGSITNQKSSQKKIYYKKVQLDAQRFLSMNQRLIVAEKCFGVDEVRDEHWMWARHEGKYYIGVIFVGEEKRDV